METSNGKRGGNLKGKPHYDENGNPAGGIKAVVTDGQAKRPVELEKGEVIINAEAAKKHWKTLSEINQSAGNGVPIHDPNSVSSDEDPEEFKDGGKVIVFNRNHIPQKNLVRYVSKLKSDHPEIWKLGGNIFGNEAFENLKRVSDRGYWLDSEKWMYIKWRSYVARHKQDFRIEGVVAMFKWVDKVEKGVPYMKQLVAEKIKSSAKPKVMKDGGVVKTDFHELDNPELSQALITIWNDFQSDIAKQLGVAKESYVIDSTKRSFVIIGSIKFNVEDKVKITSFLDPYFDYRQKPEIAKFLELYTIEGSRIIIGIRPSVKFKQGGNLQSDYSKVVSSSSRFKPTETVVFNPPLVGTNGAKLTAYTWAYEMTMKPNYEGELVGKRVSDWSQAENSAETGRDIVHKYTIELPNGETKTVSSESVPVLLGYVDRSQAKVFGNLSTAAKTLAKQQMKVAIMEAQKKEYDDLVEKFTKEPKPSIRLATNDEIPFIYRKYADKNEVPSSSWFMMDDAMEAQDNQSTYKDGKVIFTPSERPSQYTINNLTSSWIYARVKEAGGLYPHGLYELKNRLERQKRKVEQMLGGQKMEEGGSVDFEDELFDGLAVHDAPSFKLGGKITTMEETETKSRNEFLDDLHELDLWVPYDKRWYRKFNIPNDTRAREFMDNGIKEVVEDKDDRILVTLSVNSKAETARVSEVFINTYPIKVKELESKVFVDSENNIVYTVDKNSEGVWTIYSKKDGEWDKRDEYPNGFESEEDAILVANHISGILGEFETLADLKQPNPSIDTNVSTYKNAYEINRAIERLIDQKGTEQSAYTADEIKFMSYYSGYGGLEKQGSFSQDELKGILYEYYTPDEVVKKMWGLVYKYGYGSIADNSVFEPSCGTGAFLKYAPENVLVSANEINKYSATICEILYPNAQVTLRGFETNFIKQNLSIKGAIDGLKKYSLVIGNPPYGRLYSKYIAMGEDKYTMASNFTEYFIFRGLDLLCKDGLLAYIVGAEQFNGGTLFLDSGLTKAKRAIFEKADLIDAYRLPTKIFERTGVSTEILIFRKR